MGVIVFDIQCFNWNQAAKLQSSVLTASRFPWVKKGIPEWYPEEHETRTGQHVIVLHWLHGQLALGFFSTCNRHWVKGSRFFCLPVTHFVHKFSIYFTYGRAE